MFWPDKALIGYALFTAAALLLLWGVTINGKPWWRRFLPNGGEAQVQQIARKPNPRKERDREIITQGRNIVYGYTYEKPQDGFRAYLENQRAYADIRPHLSEEYRLKLEAPRTQYVKAEGASHEPLAGWFLDELDRLEREWLP